MHFDLPVQFSFLKQVYFIFSLAIRQEVISITRKDVHFAESALYVCPKNISEATSLAQAASLARPTSVAADKQHSKSVIHHIKIRSFQ